MVDARSSAEHDREVDRLNLKRLTVSAEPLTEHDGRSGALLQRVRLSDGRSLLVKRFDPRSDLACRLLGDVEGRGAHSAPAMPTMNWC